MQRTVQFSASHTWHRNEILMNDRLLLAQLLFVCSLHALFLFFLIIIYSFVRWFVLLFLPPLSQTWCFNMCVVCASVVCSGWANCCSGGTPFLAQQQPHASLVLILELTDFIITYMATSTLPQNDYYYGNIIIYNAHTHTTHMEDTFIHEAAWADKTAGI